MSNRDRDEIAPGVFRLGNRTVNWWAIAAPEGFSDGTAATPEYARYEGDPAAHQPVRRRLEPLVELGNRTAQQQPEHHRGTDPQRQEPVEHLPGAAARLGFGAESLRADHPGLVGGGVGRDLLRQ